MQPIAYKYYWITGKSPLANSSSQQHTSCWRLAWTLKRSATHSTTSLGQYSDKCTEARENEQGLLRYPREWLKPWETCHPACRATVEDMPKQMA
jgi:hypothetical protein